MRYRDLVEDGHVPGLLVHPDWWEPKHPQETPPDMTDPIALYRPAPEISVPAGHGDAENLDGGTAPTAPLGSDVCTTSAQVMNSGDTQVVLDEPLNYTIGQWVFIALDGGGYFVSRITTTADTPAITVPFTTPFSGAAAQGNQVCIGTGWAQVTQSYSVTPGDYGGNTHGYTLYGTDAGSISPSLAYITVEDGKISELVEITFYDTGVGMELFIATQNPNTFTVDPPVEVGARAAFTTWSTIEIDHSGGTTVLDTRDTGSGGDMNQGASTDGPDYSTFYFPNVAKLWGAADIGTPYQVRFIP